MTLFTASRSVLMELAISLRQNHHRQHLHHHPLSATTIILQHHHCQHLHHHPLTTTTIIFTITRCQTPSQSPSPSSPSPIIIFTTIHHQQLPPYELGGGGRGVGVGVGGQCFKHIFMTASEPFLGNLKDKIQF